VEIRVSFRAIPTKSQPRRLKMGIILRSLALIDNSFTKVSVTLREDCINELSFLLGGIPCSCTVSIGATPSQEIAKKKIEFLRG
jgi:hypothetical protein